MSDKDLEKKIRSSVSPDKNKIWGKIEREITPSGQGLELAPATGKGGTVFYKTKTFLLSICAFFVAVAVFLGVFLPIVLKDKPITPSQKFDYSGSFFIDINPSVQVIVDENGVVTDVVALNDDAVIMLYGTDVNSFKGKTGEQVAGEIWQLAFETGYITTAGKTDAKNAVLITGALSDETLNAGFGQKIQNYLTQTIKSKGVYCVVLTEILNGSLKSEADGYGISVSKYQLIQHANKLGAKIPTSRYQTITIKEVNALIAEQGKKVEKVGGNVNEILESAEDFLEELEDNPFLKDVVERLEETLDAIDDYVSDGEGNESIFDALRDDIEVLKERDAMVGKLFENILDGVETLVVETRQSFKDLHDEYRNKSDSVNYVKPSDFDDDYEEWLEEVYEEFYEQWEDKKNDYKPHARYE